MINTLISTLYICFLLKINKWVSKDKLTKPKIFFKGKIHYYVNEFKYSSKEWFAKLHLKTKRDKATS